MANRLFNPDEQYCDQNGLPYVGGTLSFFASGTSTPLATYSDKALTIPNTNPVVLDSAGRMGSVFLQNLAYKVVLADINANTIWTEDPVYSSDFSTVAAFQTFAGNPNGNVAGTAGSGTVPSSVVWDTTDNLLYVCTTTGSVSTAAWTAINSTTAAAVILTPQGYLTPTSGTPIITSDVTAATALLYTPYVGNLVPIYNGSAFIPTVFTELTLTLVASHAASQIYDIYVFNNSGAITIVSGPAWSSATAGSCARGATAAITKLNGIWVNNLSITGRNGATTYTIGANLATYVGSMFMDGTNGQISFYRGYGQSRKWAAWNAYNRAPIYLKAGDATASWTYGTATIRPSNNATANSLTTFTGLAEETIDLRFGQEIQFNSDGSSNGAVGNIRLGIGVNVTNAFSGRSGITVISMPAANNSGATIDVRTVISEFQQTPVLGIYTFTSLEDGVTASHISNTFFGTELNMVLSAFWRG